MDSNKIGKLIKELRKKNNLTQEQLADKVGVGFRAVSKWERGINIPELSNIYELCKIFNITKDELLSGELKPKDKTKDKDNSKKKITSRITITISIITIIILIISSIFIYQNNRTYSYRLLCNEKDKYYVDGKVYLNKDNISITISEIDIKDTEFKNQMIENYEYEATINNNFLFGYGYTESIDLVEDTISVGNFLQTLKLNFDAKLKMAKEEFEKGNIKFELKFIGTEKEEIIKEINLTVEPIK